MTKVSGIGERFFVNQYDLSGDVGALSGVTSGRAQQDVTTLLDVAHERLGLLRDSQLSYTAFFDTVAGAEHPVLRGLPQSGLVTWLLKTALGNPAGSMIANHSDYGVVRGQDGSLVVAPQAMSNGTGMNWGNLLTTGLQTFGSAAATTGIDDYYPVYIATAGAPGAALALPSPYGLAAYLHAVSIGSGSATVTIQDSTDNLSFANVTGGAFTAVSGATSQRIVTSATQNVRRYLRLNVTGTFTNLVCTVVVCRFVTGFGMN